MTDWVTTKEAMEMLGVGSTTIKRWADENRLRCVRTAGGHRRFDRADIERFLAESGLRPASGDEWIQLLLEDGDVQVLRDEIMRLHTRCGDWFEVADALGDVIDQIGECWENGELSVAEEHVSTSRLDLALSSVTSSFQVAPVSPVCLLATLAGEHHALGLTLARLCLRSAGVEVLLVGANTEVDGLLSHIEASKPGLVGLSASRWSTDREFLSAAYRRIAKACKDQGIELILGGVGAWPDSIDYGYRCHSFKDLRAVLKGLDL